MMMMRETIKTEDQIIDFSSFAAIQAATAGALAQQQRPVVYKSALPAIVLKQWIANLRESDAINEYNMTATLHLTRSAADPAQAAVLVKYLLEFKRLQVFALAAGTNSVIAFPSGPAVSSKLPYHLKVLSHDVYAARTLDQFTSHIPVLRVLDLPDPIEAMRKAEFEQGANGVYLVPFALCAVAASMPKVPVPPTVMSVLVQIPKAGGFAGPVYNEWFPDLLKNTAQAVKVTVAPAYLDEAQPRVLRVSDKVTTLKLELRGDKLALDTAVTTLDKLRYSFNTKLPRITAKYYGKPVRVATAVASDGGEPAGPAMAAI
ncbi:hypothetical protein AMAG_16527 [Allomyces macrogynus ATCC 38327]|uniref:Uncharacterized protein n=1 Tax=Allomyces macrogynus (strain ATCC 38327) TaxID=578462 RepID=A0A0L0TCE7_ALLM3|nr:hypothetical protein AMAG_16527 [Allomyces macrogynus ATCC 38327]|eukprot:KNE72483.1 hypothetical protein AMAG_16527 [Allomyces macrogynus ATCC 38327]